LTRAIAFLDGSRRRDYGARLARLRWRRASGADSIQDFEPSRPIKAALGAAGEWILVADSSALPAVSPIPPIPAGGLLVGRPSEPNPALHTIRELEACPAALPAREGAKPLAWAFRSAEVEVGEGETADELIRRLERRAHSDGSAWFPIVVFEEPSSRERPELTRRLTREELRILDAGCGAGAGIAAARLRHPGWVVTGIERDPRLAERARSFCDRVLEGDLREILPRLAEEGERFDALVFGDVLEHLPEPVEALRAARRLAASDAMLLASVPNVGHLSVLRDLLHGRFDPIPAGLCDVGHLRWFTRTSLREALEEAGWSSIRVDREAGAPPPEPDGLLALARRWPEGDPESLMTDQWIATAEAHRNT